MNRGWYTQRDETSEIGEQSDSARGKALLLAEIADADFIQSIIHVKSALDAFGGKAIIGSKRLKFDKNDNPIPQSKWDEIPGVFRSVAYIVQYDATPVRGEPDEPNTTFAEAEETFERRVDDAVKQAEEPVPA